MNRNKTAVSSPLSGLAGVMAYGNSKEEAIRKVKSIASQILADMIESGEELPGSLTGLFAA